MVLNFVLILTSHCMILLLWQIYRYYYTQIVNSPLNFTSSVKYCIIFKGHFTKSILYSILVQIFFKSLGEWGNTKYAKKAKPCCLSKVAPLSCMTIEIILNNHDSFTLPRCMFTWDWFILVPFLLFHLSPSCNTLKFLYCAYLCLNTSHV